jgi:hypothetical protein
MLSELSKRKIYDNFPFFSFLILFPGFFIYHYMVARSYIVPFLGGYFGVVAGVLFPFLVYVTWKSSKRTNSGTDVLFFLIMVLGLVVSTINYFYIPLFGWEREMFIWSLSGIIFNLVAYCIGVGFNLNALNIRIAFTAVFLMALLVFINIGDQGIFYVKQEAQDDFEKVATYQGFGRSLVVAVLIVAAYFWRYSFHFYLLFFFSALALFFNGARTEFSVYILTVLFVSVFYIERSYKSFWSIVLFIFMAIISYYFIVDFLPESRMFQLLDIASSSSGEARMDLFLFGLDLISSNPILGGYGQYVQLNGVGSYPHNIISAWVNLGVIGFFMYVFIFILMWRNAFTRRSAHKDIFEFKLFLFFLVFVSFSLIFSKDYSYMLVGFVVGLCANYKNKIRKINL